MKLPVRPIWALPWAYSSFLFRCYSRPASAGRNLTASFGVAEAARGEPACQILSRADAALYRAKSLGRDRVEVETCR